MTLILFIQVSPRICLRSHSNMPDTEEEVLWQARKGFIVKDEEVWVKKVGKDFDVSMGSPDGAEVAELVGLYMLSLVSKELPESGLYRDDGLGVVQLSGPGITKLVKKLHKIYNDEGLKITVEANLKVCDYLDFEMNLVTGVVKPWRKPNSNPKYINVSSCHPGVNIKSLPGMIQTRLSSLSTSEKEFKEVVEPYNEALDQAGYRDTKLEYVMKDQSNKRKRLRVTTWFNPPFNSNVTTNITKVFNNLMRKHFKKDTLLGKLFNRNNCKLSYSTMPNLNQIISGHNKNLIKKTKPVEKTKPCNCRGGVVNCPFIGECQLSDVVYEATVEATNIDSKFYLGSTATTFKIRHGNHKCDFKMPSRRNATKLASYVWSLKDEDKEHTISFKPKQRAPSYNPIAGRCKLCLTEKLLILQSNNSSYLNQRTELLAKCRHRNRYILSNLK